MNKLFICLFLWAGPALAAAGEWKCGLKEIQAGSKKEQSSGYCVREKPYQILSEDCVRGKCELLRRIKNAADADFEIKSSAQGNPGFRLCRKLGGEPRVIEFRQGAQWKPFNECRFGEDDSFANVDFLLYLAKIQRPWL